MILAPYCTRTAIIFATKTYYVLLRVFFVLPTVAYLREIAEHFGCCETTDYEQSP